MTEGQEDLDAHFERVRTAVDSVKSDLRGLSQDEAVKRLVSALRRADAFMGMGEVRVLARDLRDPWWARRHPVRAFRQTRQIFRGPDLEGIRCIAESEKVSRRVGQIKGVRGLESRRTMDGMVHAVTIDPWSDELARRVREAAAPTAVNVRPLY